MMLPSHHSPAAEMCQQDPDPLHQATRGLVVSRKHTQLPPGITAPPNLGSQLPHRITTPIRGHSPTRGHSPHTGS